MAKFYSLFFPIFLMMTNLWSETQLILVRHAETDWNKESRLQGHANNPLNAEGQRQALAFAEKATNLYPKISAIYSSDLDRAYMTAQPIAEKLNLQVHKRSDLREIDWGELDGKAVTDPMVQTFREREKKLILDYPNRKQRWDLFLGHKVEPYNQVLNRLKNGLFEIAKNHPEQTVMVFLHGRAMRIFINDLKDSEEHFPIDNCAAAHISITLEQTDPKIIFKKIE